MICIDSNILIYAFNIDSKFYEKAKNVLAKEVKDNGIAICDISLIEFFQVITNKNKLEKALTSEEAKKIIQDIIKNRDIKILYTNSEIIHQSFSTVDKYKIEKYIIYDHIIANICKYYSIKNLYSVNIKDFKKYKFLKTVMPFK